MLTAGIAAYRLWLEKGGAPALVAGHSLGEYTPRWWPPACCN
jgi:[acyl-carrier-protein] S-malonyltransferase